MRFHANKKTRSFEPGCHVNLQKIHQWLYLHIGHIFPDSYNLLFIRFLGIEVCAKCSHRFLLKIYSTNVIINTIQTNKCYKILIYFYKWVKINLITSTVQAFPIIL